MNECSSFNKPTTKSQSARIMAQCFSQDSRLTEGCMNPDLSNAKENAYHTGAKCCGFQIELWINLKVFKHL